MKTTTRQLLRKTATIGVGDLLRTALQAVYFVAIARALGVAQYGTFIATTALVAICAPFVGWGSSGLLLQDVLQKGADLPTALRTALRKVVLSGVALSVLIALSGPTLLRLGDVITFALVSVSDLLFVRLVELGVSASQARGNARQIAILQVAPVAARTVGALALLFWHPVRLHTWLVIYAASSAIASAVAAALLLNALRHSESRRIQRNTVSHIVDGAAFAVSGAALNIYNDIDKSILAAVDGALQAGFYAAGYRITEIIFVPLRSLLFATYGDFFEAGKSGMRAAANVARSLLPISAIYAAAIGLLTYLFAPLVPEILGAEYVTAVPVIRMLCVLPAIRIVHYLAANALTGAGMQIMRTGTQVFVALVNVLMCIWWIPKAHWAGAAAATLASEALLAALLWFEVFAIAAPRRAKEASS